MSDPHFGGATSRPAVAPFVRAVVADPALEFAVVTGDLTAGGFDGKVTCGCLAPFLGANNAVVGGSRDDQLGAFLDAVVEPVQRAGKAVYLVAGNHDQYNGAGRHPVDDFIRRAHGDTHYSVVRGGVMLLFCGVYPDEAVRAWLATMLRDNHMPVVFFFHYNLQGAFSDWWPDSEKEAFREAIQDKRVLGIFVGHRHETYAETWCGYSVYGTAGDNAYAVCEVSADRLRLTVTFTNV